MDQGSLVCVWRMASSAAPDEHSTWGFLMNLVPTYYSCHRMTAIQRVCYCSRLSQYRSVSEHALNIRTKSKPSKNLPPVQTVFSTKTACNPQFRLKVTKITLLVFTVQIKNVLKHDQNRVKIIIKSKDNIEFITYLLPLLWVYNCTSHSN